ncbi:MAG: hypothetical protein ABI882_09440 [Acidobacteriota bacterium]
MSFIIRIVLILIVFSFVIYVLKAITRLSVRLRGTARDVNQIRERMRQPENVSAEMVRCQSCGAFVAVDDSIQLKMGKKSLSYCSEACLKTHRIRA